MPIYLAKSAGFCFGVKRAVDMTRECLAHGASVCMLGELIHNRQVTRELREQGARTVQKPDECSTGDMLVIRAHGVPKDTMEEIHRLGIACCDATCPFVAHIQQIVAEHSAPGATTIIAGNPDHPEVIGIQSYARGEATVVQSAEFLAELLKNDTNWRESAVIAVAQTTFRAEEWKKCIEILKYLCTNVKIFDTICYATQSRQEEARLLAQTCDVMVIIGDRLSSNTRKLQAVCEELCPSFLVEGTEQLLAYRKELSASRIIGCTAGASTPARTIKEVLHTMSELTNESLAPEINATPLPEELIDGAIEPQEAAPQAPEEAIPAEADVPVEEIPEAISEEAAEEAIDEAPAVEEAVAEAKEAAETTPQAIAAEPLTAEEEFNAALEENLKGMSTDQKVKGIVTAVNPSEIQVDIGRKQTGYVAASEYSSDPNADPSKEVKVGDEMDLIILKTNDAEGTVQLSKRKFDSARSWLNIVEAEETGAALEGKVIDVIKGGVLVMSGGMRVFVPASQTSLPRNADLEDLRGQTVRFRVIEVNKQRRRAVGSIRAVAQEERRAAQRAFWETAEAGQVFQGKVKSLVSYGAFVDIGGLDGMVHISELSWGRVKDPSEVVNVGDEVEVYIKSLDSEKGKISLGYRKLEDNPWEIMRRQYPVDSVAEASIVSFTSFGAFARILPGVDGLIHISQIANRRVEKPQEELAIGQTVRVKIVGIDFDKRRVSLSIRALLDDEPIQEEIPDDSEDEIVFSTSTPDDDAPALIFEEAPVEAPTEEAPIEEASAE